MGILVSAMCVNTSSWLKICTVCAQMQKTGLNLLKINLPAVRHGISLRGDQAEKSGRSDENCQSHKKRKSFPAADWPRWFGQIHRENALGIYSARAVKWNVIVFNRHRNTCKSFSAGPASTRRWWHWKPPSATRIHFFSAENALRKTVFAWVQVSAMA